MYCIRKLGCDWNREDTVYRNKTRSNLPLYKECDYCIRMELPLRSFESLNANDKAIECAHGIRSTN